MDTFLSAIVDPVNFRWINCCDCCGKKRYVERINGHRLCLDCQDVITEQTTAAEKQAESDELPVGK